MMVSTVEGRVDGLGLGSSTSTNAESTSAECLDFQREPRQEE